MIFFVIPRRSRGICFCLCFCLFYARHPERSPASAGRVEGSARPPVPERPPRLSRTVPRHSAERVTGSERSPASARTLTAPVFACGKPVKRNTFPPGPNFNPFCHFRAKKNVSFTMPTLLYWNYMKNTEGSAHSRSLCCLFRHPSAHSCQLKSLQLSIHRLCFQYFTRNPFRMKILPGGPKLSLVL